MTPARRTPADQSRSHRSPAARTPSPHASGEGEWEGQGGGGGFQDESAASTAPAAAVPSPFTDRQLLRLYGNLGKSLDRHHGTVALGDYLRRRRTGEDPAPTRNIAATDGIVRWLRRMGVLPPRGDRESQNKVAEHFVREIAETVSRTPVEVATLFNLFTAGLPGDERPPVCGATPQCAACLVTKDCDHHNAPARPMNEPIPPLKRLAHEGAKALTDEELLAVLTGASARAGERDMEAARELLARYGTLRGLFQAEFGELSGLRAVNDAMAARLAVVGELHRRLLSERRYFGPTIRTASDFFDIYHPRMRELKKEVFILVMLDQRSRIMKDERLSEGTLTYTLVHPREVFSPAVREVAAMVALIHNHPSGDSTPSAEDIALTSQMEKAAEIMQIPLLDHIIIGEGGYTSMVDLEVMQPPRFYHSTGHGNIIA